MSTRGSGVAVGAVERVRAAAAAVRAVLQPVERHVVLDVPGERRDAVDERGHRVAVDGVCSVLSIGDWPCLAVTMIKRRARAGRAPRSAATILPIEASVCASASATSGPGVPAAST